MDVNSYEQMKRMASERETNGCLEKASPLGINDD